MAAKNGMTDRAGWRIGDLEVLHDSGKRSKKCEVIWVCRNVETGELAHKRSGCLARMERRLGLPRPWERGE